MTDKQALLLAGCKSQATRLAEALEAAHQIAEDNVQDWWEPLTDVPVDQINAVQLAINAKEGASRAHGALLLLRQAVDVAGALERSVYALRVQKAEAE